VTGLGEDARGGAPRRRGLGMGPSPLLDTSQDELPTVGSERSRLVPIEFLRPCPLQPRRRFAEDELAALADSIRHRGVIQPLLVRRAPSGADFYEIIAGERRWRAAQMAGAHELPVIVHELSDRDALEVALLENVQRQDLSALEEAEGYRRLVEEFGHTQEALAGTLGKSRSHIANLLRLLGLPPAVRALLEGGELSAGHARALLGAREPAELAKVVVGRGLNVRQTEALVRADAERPERRRQAPATKDPNTLALERDLSTRLGLPVSLTPRGAGGTLEIAYGSLDQLDDVLRRLS
jgi:ParB family transcriptional regulator, chromosome partitioning protein